MQVPEGGRSLQGLAGYGDSDGSGAESAVEEAGGVPAILEQQTREYESSDGEESRRQARRERARDWSARRRADQHLSEEKR